MESCAKSDQAGIAMFCESLSEFVRARDEFIADPSKDALHRLNSAEGRLRWWIASMGFSPADQARVDRIESKGSKLDSPFGRKSSLNTNG